MPTPTNNVYRFFWLFGVQLVVFGLFELFSRIRKKSQQIAPLTSAKPKNSDAPSTLRVIEGKM